MNNNIENIQESSSKPVDSFNIYIDMSHEEFKTNKQALIMQILTTIAAAVGKGITIGNLCDEDENFLASFYFKDPKKLN